MSIRFSMIAALVVLLGARAEAQTRPLVVVLVIDGLRPDMIRADIMPNLERLKREGVWFANAHSVFPTVTRVNSASISTGTAPSEHGIVSNTMLVEGVSPKPFDTSNYLNLVKLAEVSGGRTLPVRTMAESLEAGGIRFVAISSGSTGGAFLMNPQAPSGNGVLINGSLVEGSRVAFPDKVNQEILKGFGSEKSDAGISSVLWTERVLRDYVIAELHPGVIVDWMTEPDGSQHQFGVGSPQALAALKATDEQIGLLLGKLRERGAERTTDIIVTADHGFGAEPDPVDLNGALQATGKAGDVIVANNGASALLYVKNHSLDVIKSVVGQLQKTDGVDLIFTSAAAAKGGVVECVADQERGWIQGTFSLELIHECSPSRGADVIVTFQWSSEKNAFGFPGTQKIATTETRRGVPGRSGHGGLNPFMVHTPMLMWGPDFRRHAVVGAPVANYDIAPTLLKLEGLTVPSTMSGRVIAEGFAKGGTKEPTPRMRLITVRSGSFCSTIQLTVIGKSAYVDQGQRCAP
jgi:predicted AlkP superfamily pyrophosphatase or phosphodiesterase